MILPTLSAWQWLVAIVAAMSIGLGKAGFSGIGLVAVIGFASIFGALDSTGVVVPLLIVADIGAVTIFRQHTNWHHVRRTLMPALAGVAIGALAMLRMDNEAFRTVLGAIIFALTCLQLVRLFKPSALGDVPHSRAFAVGLGFLAGLATMIANAAGPLVALYYAAVGLPKFEVVGTIAWFFFIVNLVKVPFSVSLGLIHVSSLVVNVVLIPAVMAGLLGGRWLIHRVPQRVFDGLLVVFAAVASVRLMIS